MRLLAMLEPAVRPGNLPAASARLLQRAQSAEAGLPLEQRSFASLLEQVQTGRPTAGSPEGGHGAMTEAGGDIGAEGAERIKRYEHPLAWLGRPDRIENASVREIHATGPEARGLTQQAG